MAIPFGLPPLIALLAFTPLLISVGVLGTQRLEHFVLYGVMVTMVFPAAVAHPAGTEVAIAPLLLVASLGMWLVAAGRGKAPRPVIEGNPMLLPCVLFAIWNFASVAWSAEPRQTAAQAVQTLEIAVVLPLVFGSIPRSTKIV